MRREKRKKLWEMKRDKRNNKRNNEGKLKVK